MKKESKRDFWVAAYTLTAFILWTAAVKIIDVQPIGPQETSVGFASLNHFVHGLTGVHMALYIITDWLGLVPLCFVIGFAVLGLMQWIRRKSIFKVDYSILILGVFYIVVMAVYVLFEMVVINYRPVLINGYLETSYPSSTTMLVLCVMPTAIMQLYTRIKNNVLRICIAITISVFIVFMVIARLLSGVHWFTDIMGGILLSEGLVVMYRAFSSLGIKQQE